MSSNILQNLKRWEILLIYVLKEKLLMYSEILDQAIELKAKLNNDELKLLIKMLELIDNDTKED